MSELLINTSDDTFKDEILQSDLPVVVDFWAEWCGPCLMMAPVFEELAGEYEGKLRFAKLDTDANEATMMRYGVQGIPTLLFFNKGELVGQLVGFRPKRDLKQHIDQILAESAKDQLVS